MASVTAFFLVGSTHPYDVGFDPSFIVKLYEGDRAIWQATDVMDSDKVIVMEPEDSSPEQILAAGCKLVDLLANNFRTDAAGLVVFRGSSVEGPSADVEKSLSIKLAFSTKV